MRRKKLIIIAVVAVVLLLVGSIGGIALAQTPTPTPDSSKTLLGRVATILGIDQTKVESAFAQAQKDIQNEALDNYLQKQVDSGKITKEQADQYKSWAESRPDIPAVGRGFGRMGGHMSGFGGGFGGMGGHMRGFGGGFGGCFGGAIPGAT